MQLRPKLLPPTPRRWMLLLLLRLQTQWPLRLLMQLLLRLQTQWPLRLLTQLLLRQKPSKSQPSGFELLKEPSRKGRLFFIACYLAQAVQFAFALRPLPRHNRTTTQWRRCNEPQ